MNELEVVASRMNTSLLNIAALKGVDIDGITEENWQEFLDFRFQDGGDARVEHFIRVADDYAYSFGIPDQPAFESAVDGCLALALPALIEQVAQNIRIVKLAEPFPTQLVCSTTDEKVRVVLPAVTFLRHLRWRKGEVRVPSYSGNIKVKTSGVFPHESYDVEADVGYYEVDFELENTMGRGDAIATFSLRLEVK